MLDRLLIPDEFSEVLQSDKPKLLQHFAGRFLFGRKIKINCHIRASRVTQCGKYQAWIALGIASRI